MPVNPNDPAFPEGGYQHGLTIRVWLAGQALGGMAGCEPVLRGDATKADMAKHCVQAADALIAALNRTEVRE